MLNCELGQMLGVPILHTNKTSQSYGVDIVVDVVVSSVAFIRQVQAHLLVRRKLYHDRNKTFCDALSRLAQDCVVWHIVGKPVSQSTANQVDPL